MSAQGRARQPENLGEFFPTPAWVVHSLLESVSLPGGIWIEPCAGTGKIIQAVNEVREDISWSICEIDRGFEPFLSSLLRPQDTLHRFGDFVNRTWDHTVADVLIMNPPFSLTMDFVMTGFERAHNVVCLQRGNWFGSKSRAPWFREHCPNEYALPKRPSFRPDGKTDNCEYSWFIWPRHGKKQRQGSLMMLDTSVPGQKSFAIE